MDGSWQACIHVIQTSVNGTERLRRLLVTQVAFSEDWTGLTGFLRRFDHVATAGKQALLHSRSAAPDAPGMEQTCLVGENAIQEQPPSLPLCSDACTAYTHILPQMCTGMEN